MMGKTKRNRNNVVRHSKHRFNTERSSLLDDDKEIDLISLNEIHDRIEIFENYKMERRTRERSPDYVHRLSAIEMDDNCRRLF